jgi:hypothetical protein
MKFIGKKLIVRGATEKAGGFRRYFFRHADIGSRKSTFISPGREDKRSACYATGLKLHRELYILMSLNKIILKCIKKCSWRFIIIFLDNNFIDFFQ